MPPRILWSDAIKRDPAILETHSNIGTSILKLDLDHLPPSLHLRQPSANKMAPNSTTSNNAYQKKVRKEKKEEEDSRTEKVQETFQDLQKTNEGLEQATAQQGRFSILNKSI